MFHKSYFMMVLLAPVLGHVHSEIIMGGSKTLMSMPRKPCKVPHFKGDYYYTSSDNRKFDHNENIEGSGQTVVKVKCFNSNRIIINDFALCFDGNWFPSGHNCKKRRCHRPYETVVQNYSCTNPKGVQVDCRQPALPGSRITIQCSYWRYRTVNNKTTQKRTCLEDGEWEKWNDCKLQCGRVLNNSTLEMNNSIPRVLYEHPWHAVVYHYNDDKWNQICVGTLISRPLPTQILTSDNCFKGNWRELWRFKIALGKYNRDYKIEEPLSSQMYNVVDVFSFRKLPHFLSFMIGDKVEYSDTVVPICPYNDWIGKTGHIVGWEKDGKGAMVQVKRSMIYESYENCKASKEIENIIQSNQFCSLSNEHVFTAEEIGSGFVFQNTDGRFTLQGVLVAISPDGKIPIFTSTRHFSINLEKPDDY